MCNRIGAVMPKSWNLENAQKLADEFIYTFYKPSKEVISLLNVGDKAKLIIGFESDDSEDPSAERMWVEITERIDNKFIGYLDNDPAYIKDLKYKDIIEFSEIHIVDTDLDDPIPAISEKYIKRCFVKNNILDEGEAIGYLYREEPDAEDDSGWRFTTGSETDEYMNNSENSSYVSLGVVLREDDSVVHLLEHTSGIAFAKDQNGNFVKLN